MRSLVEQSPFVLFTAILAVHDAQDLEQVIRKADAFSRLFFERNRPSGPPEMKGIWTAGTTVSTIRGSRKPHPTLMYTGADRNQLSIFEKADEAVDLLAAMLHGLVQEVKEIDTGPPTVLFYGNKEYLVDLSVASFNLDSSPSIQVTAEIREILAKYGL